MNKLLNITAVLGLICSVYIIWSYADKACTYVKGKSCDKQRLIAKYQLAVGMSIYDANEKLEPGSYHSYLHDLQIERKNGQLVLFKTYPEYDLRLDIDPCSRLITAIR